MAYCKVILLGKAVSGLLGKAASCLLGKGDSGLVVQERKVSKAVCLPCLTS